jgi:hypothetical protein
MLGDRRTQLPQAPAPAASSAQGSYSVAMANATEHESISRLPIVDRYQALEMHTRRELAMLADVFDRRPDSGRVKALLAKRDRTEEEFAKDKKRWSDLRDELRTRSKAFEDDIGIRLQEGDGSMPVYVIDVPGHEGVRALGRDFPAVYDRYVGRHNDSVFENSLRELEDKHDVGHELMAIYGVYGYASRFSHLTSYGTQERQSEHEETLAAKAAGEGAGLSAFSRHPSATPVASEPPPEPPASESRDGDDAEDGEE